MTWEREEWLLPQPPAALAGCHPPCHHPVLMGLDPLLLLGQVGPK